MPGYFYSVSDKGIWVHLYAQGSARLQLTDGRVVGLTLRTGYPWDGEVAIEIVGDGAFSLMLRIPAWCEEGAGLGIGGRPFDGELRPGSYVEVRRTWRRRDDVRLSLPMPVRRVECHPYVAENAGRVALMRGPLLYCLEGVDNAGFDLRDVVLGADTEFSTTFRPDLLDGVVALRGEAEVVPPGDAWADRLYRPVEITAVPYYAWANREPGPMRVWLRDL